jgi:hypothetical protein
MNITSKLMMLTAIAVLTTSEAANSQSLREPPLSVGPTYNEALVYADVAAVAKPDDSLPYHRLTLRVKCTLAGPYDAARFPIVVVGIGRGDWLLAPEPTIPSVNSHVVALLMCQSYPHGVPWYVSSHRSGIPFMPSGKAVAEVSSFDDPRVVDIIARMRNGSDDRAHRWDAACQAIDVESSRIGLEPGNAIGLLNDAAQEAESAKPSPQESLDSKAPKR